MSLSEEELTRKVESLLAEFCQTLDKKEATMCVRELGSPELLAKVMEMGLVSAQGHTLHFATTFLLWDHGPGRRFSCDS